jgi:hypothetical protein
VAERRILNEVARGIDHVVVGDKAEAQWTHGTASSSDAARNELQDAGAAK